MGRLKIFLRAESNRIANGGFPLESKQYPQLDFASQDTTAFQSIGM